MAKVAVAGSNQSAEMVQCIACFITPLGHAASVSVGPMAKNPKKAALKRMMHHLPFFVAHGKPFFPVGILKVFVHLSFKKHPPWIRPLFKRNQLFSFLRAAVKVKIS